MTDFSTHGSTHPAPPFPRALNGVLYAGSVKPLHKSPQCPQALRTNANWRDRLKLKLISMPVSQQLQSPSGPAQRCGPVHGRRLKRRLLNWYRIVGANSQSRRHRHMVSDRLRLQCDRSKSALFSLREKVAFWRKSSKFCGKI